MERPAVSNRPTQKSCSSAVTKFCDERSIMVDISREMLRNLFQMTLLVTGSSMSTSSDWAACTFMNGVPRSHVNQVIAVKVDLAARSVRHHDGRAFFLDQRRTGDLVAGGQLQAVIDRRHPPAVGAAEIAAPVRLACAVGGFAALRDLAQMHRRGRRH